MGHVSLTAATLRKNGHYRSDTTTDLMRPRTVLLIRRAFLIFGANLLLSAPLPLNSEQAVRPAAREAGAVQFHEVAAESGITFRHERGASAEKHMVETF